MEQGLSKNAHHGAQATQIATDDLYLIKLVFEPYITTQVFPLVLVLLQQEAWEQSWKHEDAGLSNQGGSQAIPSFHAFQNMCVVTNMLLMCFNEQQIVACARICVHLCAYIVSVHAVQGYSRIVYGDHGPELSF